MESGNERPGEIERGEFAESGGEETQMERERGSCVGEDEDK